jgi:hypothetical protein
MNSMTDKDENKQNAHLLKLALITLHILLENCPNAMHDFLGQVTEVCNLNNI